MNYKKLIKALTCSCAEDEPDNLGCKNRKCKYRDTDGACNVVSMCKDAAIAIEKLLKKVKTIERERDAIKARYTEEEPCVGCKHYYEHTDDCNYDCLTCARNCLCNTCCEHSNWEYCK